jgi:hypothetical protein
MACGAELVTLVIVGLGAIPSVGSDEGLLTTIVGGRSIFMAFHWLIGIAGGCLPSVAYNLITVC